MSRSSLDLSRRRFLQLAAVSSAGLALPRRALAGPSNEIFDAGSTEVPGGALGDPERVIVVGAGFAGLATANALANAGVEVVVLESRDRIGGRAYTRDVVGVPVDQGCSWIHSPIGNPMAQWADQLGVFTFSAEPTEDVATFTGYDAATGPLAREEVIAAFFQTLVFEAQLPSLLAALGGRATVEDAIQRFLETNGLQGDLRRRAELVIRYIFESGFAAPSDDLSLDALVNFPPDPNPYDGTDVFPLGGYRALLEPLGRGIDVRLRHRVTRIEHSPSGVVVHARVKQGRKRRTRRFRGSHVVVTLPLGVLKSRRVDFDPLLPVPKERAIQRLGLGFLEKVSLGFDEPFWREGGRTHLFFGSATPGEFPSFVDMQRWGLGPVLQGFVGGDFGRRMSRMSRREIKTRVLEILREVYGSSVPRPREVLITRWFSDPNTRGSYSSMPVGAGYEDFDALAEPVDGRLLFAGEATSKLNGATADGALRTGVREAKRLLGQPSVRLRPLGGAAAAVPTRLERWLGRVA